MAVISLNRTAFLLQLKSLVALFYIKMQTMNML